MNRRNKRITTYFILFSMILVIGIIYAILQANLQINGTAKISENQWNVHFNNIQVTPGSVEIGQEDVAATIDPNNNCKVDFSVTLSLPGDFYEFTVDVVNEGTIDGMIGNLVKTLKVNGEDVQTVPDFLNYSVTYVTGDEILENHILEKGQTETYKVLIEYKSDIDSLPQGSLMLSTSVEPVFIQADSGAIQVIHPKNLYDVFPLEIENNTGLVREYTGEHNDSFTEEPTHKIYHWYASNESSANNVLNKWNIIFGGFCWQMIRTTDTGGVKIIYNGIPDNGTCNNTALDTSISVSKFNDEYNSLASVGYMYNSATMLSSTGTYQSLSGYYFGEDVVYDNGVYSLINTGSLDNNHRYSCYGSTSCATVRYYHLYSSPSYYYIEISDGRTIEQVFSDMLSNNNTNQNNSLIKTEIDNWYETYLIDYSDYLEDVIFCGERSIKDSGGWVLNQGSFNNSLVFSGGEDNSLFCQNIINQFSTKNVKALLSYPIGLMNVSEMSLSNYISLRKTNANYWLLTPFRFGYYSSVYYVSSTGGVANSNVSYEYGIRPSVSLKPGTTYQLGDGSRNNPYIIE